MKLKRSFLYLVLFFNFFKIYLNIENSKNFDINVSPFLTEDCAAEKLITSAESLFCANSKDSFVRVLFSKNILAIVMSLSEGTFLMGRLMTSLK